MTTPVHEATIEPSEVRPSAAFREITLAGILREHRRVRPQEIAVIDEDGHRYSYAELADRVMRLADGLRRSGIVAGDRILWIGQTSHRCFEAILAASALGAMVCPSNWRLGAEEFALIAEDLDPAAIIWEGGILEKHSRHAITAARPDVLSLQHDGRGHGSYEAFVAASRPDDPDEEIDASRPLVIIYTAGFEGRTAGALITQRNITAQMTLMSWMQRISYETIFLAAGPMFHIGVWITIFPTFMQGGTNVFIPKADPELICSAIHEHRCTDAYILAPSIPKILEANADGRYDLKSLHSSLDDPAWQEMVSPELTPWAQAMSFYGQTELQGVVVHAAFGGHREGLGTRGRTVPGAEVRLFDDEDREVPDGEVGEIVVRGPMVCAGYWNRPEVNALRTRSGWWHTNDLGRREPDGSIQFVGTKVRMLKCGHENIYPTELERCLLTHDEIVEAAIIGVPDDKWTQVVKAIVVRAEGSDLDAASVIEHCRQLMASYKKPHYVEFIDSLPRTSAGIDYDALDAAFGGGAYPGGATRAR